jgi:hypothetical protein
MEKTEEQRVAEWMHKIKQGEKYRKKYGGSANWDKFAKYYTGDYKDSVVPLNMVFAVGRSLVPRVYFRNPQVVVSSAKPSMYIQAQLVESTDNWLVHRIGLKREIKRSVLDCYLNGTGIIKTGYDSEYGYVGKEEARENSEVEQTIQEEFAEYINPFDSKNEFNSNVLPGMPWALRVRPDHFIVPWGAMDIHSSPWVAHMYYRLANDVKEDPKFSNTEELVGTHSIMERKDGELDSTFSRIDNEDDADYVKLYEISDMRTGKMLVLAEGHKKFLLDTEDALLINGHKYFALKWNERTDSFWGLSEVKIFEPQQKELNEIRSQYRDHRRVANLKVLGEQGVFSPEEKRKFLNGEVGSYVEVNDIDKVKPYVANYVRNDLLLAADQVKQDIREIIGFSNNAMGEYDDSSRRTAREAMIVHQSNQIRVDERRDVVADVFVALVERMNQYIFDFWTTTRVAKILGQSRALQWVKFTGEEIRGDYSLRVDPDTMQAMTSDRRRYEAQELATMLTKFPPELINMSALVRFLVEQYPAVNVESLLNMPQTTPEKALSIGEAYADESSQPTIDNEGLAELIRTLGGKGNAIV